MQNRYSNYRQAIVYKPVHELKRNPNNPRRHPEQQIEQIARNIAKYGFNVPVLIDESNELIAGEARVQAALKVGLPEIPTICISHLTAKERRAFVIADNRLAERATWDDLQLADELRILGMDLEFDFDSIGFQTAEIDIMLEWAPASPAGAADALPAIDTGETAISTPGDLWKLDDHRLVCGDARDPDAYDVLLAGDEAMMVIADPPCTVPIEGREGRTGSAKPWKAAGGTRESEYQAFLAPVLSNLAQASANGSMHYIFIEWRHTRAVLDAAAPVYSLPHDICVWNKTKAATGSLYCSKHVFVFVFKHGDAAHINNVARGRHGRRRTNVWDYADIDSSGRDPAVFPALLPTIKPVALIADAIKDCSKRGGIILDPFVGSGTTLIAAEKTGRRGAAIEINPLYVDAAVRRWQAFTGKQAVLAATGRTFDEEVAIRTAEDAGPPAINAGRQAQKGPAQ